MSTMKTPLSQIISVSDLAWQDRQPGVHRHVGDELIFLLEGANADESGPVATGNMNYRPNGCVHTVTTTNGATVLAVVWGRTEPA